MLIVERCNIVTVLLLWSENFIYIYIYMCVCVCVYIYNFCFVLFCFPAILKDADLTTMSAKKVRQQIEEKLDVDLTDR